MTATRLSDGHRRHISALRRLPAIIDAEGLRIGSQYVMFFAEAELMREHATRLVAGVSQPDVLEVGLGLGVFADQLLDLEIGSYTAIEPHQAVVALAERRVLRDFGEQATVHIEPWQLVPLPSESYDAIMYDTWPPDGQADADFATFVEHTALRCLRPGGRFSFFHSGTVLSDARRTVLDQYFAGWETHPYTMPEHEVPANWTKPTTDFLIPIATKGDRR